MQISISEVLQVCTVSCIPRQNKLFFLPRPKQRCHVFVVAGQFNKLVYDFPIRIPERFSLVIRSLLTQEGICFTLKPDFKFLEVKLHFDSFLQV